MKKILLIIILGFIINSCSKNEELENLQVKEDANSTETIVQSLQQKPLQNANLLPLFDWTASSWTTYFRNSIGTIGVVNTLNPFIDGTQSIFGNVNITNADMNPQNGWVLVARDFGSPDQANTYPFIMLYNKFRGVLRVCILRTYDNLTSYQRMTLSFASSNPVNPVLFKYASNPVSYNSSSFTNNDNSNFKQCSVSKAGLMQWMIGEFNVQGYQPTIESNASIVVNLDEIADSNMVLSGNISLDGTIQPQTQGNSLWSGLKTLGTAVASSSNATAIKAITAQNATAENIASGAGTLLSSISNVVTGFTGGKSGSTYNIKLAGTINLSGSIQLTNPRTSFSVYLNPQPSNPDAYSALQNIKWGVFNFIPLPASKSVSFGSFYSTVTVTTPVNYISNCLNINPNIQQNINNIKVKIDQYSTGYYGPPGVLTTTGFIPLNQYDSTIKTYIEYIGGPIPLYGQSALLPHLAVNLNIGVQITFNDGSVVYQMINNVPLK